MAERRLRATAAALRDQEETLASHLANTDDPRDREDIRGRIAAVRSRADGLKRERGKVLARSPPRVPMETGGLAARVRGSPKKGGVLRQGRNSPRKGLTHEQEAYAQSLRAQVAERDAWRKLEANTGDLAGESEARKSRARFLGARHREELANRGQPLKYKPPPLWRRERVEKSQRDSYKAILDEQIKTRNRLKQQPKKPFKLPPKNPRLEEPYMMFSFQPPKPDPDMPRVPPVERITLATMERKKDRRPPWMKF